MYRRIAHRDRLTSRWIIHAGALAVATG
jgi:hypothetical protein